MKLAKKVFVVLIGLFCLLGHSVIGEAAKALPPGMVIGDSDGMYATSEGEYYIDLVDILPGDTFEKEITIRSLDLEEPFSLGMLVQKEKQSGVIDWNDYITMTLILDGKEIYQGPLLGDGSFDWSKTPLELGVCKYGTDKLMKAQFTVDTKLTNEHYREDNILTFHWTFVGTKDQPTEPTTEPTSDSSTSPTTSSGSSTPTSPSSSQQGGTPKSSSGSGKQYPRTGEDVRDALYKFLVGILIVLIVLFLWKKKREEEQK